MDFRDISTDLYDMKCIKCGELMELVCASREEKAMELIYLCNDCRIESFVSSIPTRK